MLYFYVIYYILTFESNEWAKNIRVIQMWETV